jgi:hypothetical protein
MGILPLRPARRRLVQTSGNGVLGNLPMLDRGRRNRGSWHVLQESLKHRWGRIGADSVPPRSTFHTRLSSRTVDQHLFLSRRRVVSRTKRRLPVGPNNGQSPRVLETDLQ